MPSNEMMIDSQRMASRSCLRVMPTARSNPISWVRSTVDSARVLAMPTRAMMMASPSSA